MTHRCFYALLLPEPLKRSLEERLREFSRIPGVNWTQAQNLHLTMLFLGDVKVELIPALKDILFDLSRSWKPISMAARGIELFPAREPRLVWASLQTDDNAIFDMHRELRKRARELDIETDNKPLKLHITLGRIKHQIQPHLERSILESAVDTQDLAFEDIALLRSQLRPEGPIYNIIEQSILR